MRQTEDAAGAGGTAQVDTGRVTDLRAVRFASIDALLTDVERLAAAERAGTLRRAGNWTLGQALGHLATWVDFSYDGNPLKPPWFVRVLVRMRKKRYLTEGLPRGVKIPRVEGGTLGTERLPLDEGLARYRNSLERLRREAPTKPNVIFGPLTHDEWIALQLRHAELHLGFFKVS